MKASFHIKPDLDHNAANSDLLLIAGTGHCSFAIMNHLSRELVEFGYFTADDDADYRKFFEETGLTANRYYQTAIAYDANESVQIPSVVYRYEDGQMHLDTLYGKTLYANILSENLPAFNLYNVYRVPATIQSTISRQFLSSKSWHFYTVILKNVSSANGKLMFIDFRTDEFSLIVLREGKVLLCQTFGYAAPSDVLYQLLKCCQQFSLSQQTSHVFLSGLIEKDSAVFRELYKYFINLEFESLAANIKLSTALSIHPEHYYSSITKLASCVL